MPSGKTHDVVTFLLAAPAFAAGYFATGEFAPALAAAASFFFGGLMFGPDLDTVSKQYSRWGPLRLLWFPYRMTFKHRSRWSHGLLFGTLFRVVYFTGIVGICFYLCFVVKAAVMGSAVPELSVFARVLGEVGGYLRAEVGFTFLITIFVGMWAGAASHTFTDMAGTYIKTGRVSGFL